MTMPDHHCSDCNRPISDGALWLDKCAALVTDEIGKADLQLDVSAWRPFHRTCLQERFPAAQLPHWRTYAPDGATQHSPRAAQAVADRRIRA